LLIVFVMPDAMTDDRVRQTLTLHHSEDIQQHTRRPIADAMAGTSDLVRMAEGFASTLLDIWDAVTQGEVISAWTASKARSDNLPIQRPGIYLSTRIIRPRVIISTF
jgi:hypothetical protein